MAIFMTMMTTGDDAEEEQLPVTLGFAEKPKNRWSLLRQLFPSKAGGVPAWLDPLNLPYGRSRMCDFCGEPLQFLLQVYAPLSEKDSTFHRTLFVFMCPSMKCHLKDQHEQWKRHSQNTSRRFFVANCPVPILFTPRRPQDTMELRNRLELELHFVVGAEPGREIKFAAVAEEHAMHWRSGHKIQCQQLAFSPQASDSITNSNLAEMQKSKYHKFWYHYFTADRMSDLLTVASSMLWQEFEIINEDESEFDLEMSDNDGYANSLVSQSQMDESVKSMLHSFEGDDDKKSWASFQERISRVPEQVLRYCRYARAKPLWPMSSGRPSTTDIPKCNHCGGLRGFEFQILPQLLYYFGVKNDVDSLDWATIVVYACEASCEGSMAYREEFAWLQLVSQSTTALG
ncbi:hypothetical protein RJ639_014323 [Escallonia herrerae]|uniref:Programmed cell death protein 2 C-terminal domain-containing protein n=1 Tax=Escallonia herrerae TaxID=1293975 RepID=A0AA88VI92_9ASTE|nr:hypothetical protein RJ639_014323 [Escallonia herrerae]